jgi:hypothetical protein
MHAGSKADNGRGTYLLIRSPGYQIQSGGAEANYADE